VIETGLRHTADGLLRHAVHVSLSEDKPADQAAGVLQRQNKPY
jgi:hypothetical protein